MNKIIEQKYFKLFNIVNKNFIFLAGSQHVMELTTQDLETYFYTAAGVSMKNQVDENIANEFTESLNELKGSVEIPKDQDVSSKQVILTLNTTHGCNMACKYCFASTADASTKVMPLSVARKTIQNLLKQFLEAELYMMYFLEVNRYCTNLLSKMS